jgi:hypothetical protein
MTQNILRLLRADPTIASISVSNMDGVGGAAPCALDMIAATKENATGAGNFYAVQFIAAAVAQDFPHVKIMTLAYGSSFLPPKRMRFADNVIIRVVGDKPEVVKGWLKAAKTVYLWDGSVNNGQILVRL